MDAIDQVLALNVGDTFILRGRAFTVSRYSGSTHGCDGSGVYFRLPVWTESGREIKVTVRPHYQVAARQKGWVSA